MDAKQELDVMLTNPECHAILVNALGDYAGTLRASLEDSNVADEAAYFERCIRHVESLSDIFYRWP